MSQGFKKQQVKDQHSYIFFMEFTPCKAEHPLQGMEL